MNSRSWTSFKITAATQTLHYNPRNITGPGQFLIFWLLGSYVRQNFWMFYKFVSLQLYVFTQLSSCYTFREKWYNPLKYFHLTVSMFPSTFTEPIMLVFKLDLTFVIRSLCVLIIKWMILIQNFLFIQNISLCWVS